MRPVHLLALLLIIPVLLPLPASADSSSLLSFRETTIVDDGTFSYLLTPDLDGDSTPDLFAAGHDGTGLRAWTSVRGEGYVPASDGLPDSGSFGQCAAADIDGDGRTDVAAAGSPWVGNRGIHVYLNRAGDDGEGVRWVKADGPDDAAGYNGVDIRGDLLVAGGKVGISAWRYDGGDWEEVSDGLPTAGEYTGVTLEEAGGDVFAIVGSYSGEGISVWMQAEGNDSWEDVTSEGLRDATEGSQGQATVVTTLGDEGDAALVASFGGSSSRLAGLRAWSGTGGIGGWGAAEVSQGLPDDDWCFQFGRAEVWGDAGAELVAGSGKAGRGIGVWSLDAGVWNEVETDLPDEGSYYAVTTVDVHDDDMQSIIAAPMGDGIRVYEPVTRIVDHDDEETPLEAALVVMAFLAAVVVTVAGGAGRRRRFT